jgi:class 3 adenylate cyclase
MAERRSLVLAVDDNPADLALLRKLIPRLGYGTIEASDGLKALELIRERQPDLVLLDVMIPGLDGFEVCRRVRSQPEFAGLPILMLTALDQASDLAAGLEAGANDFLAKPFNEVELTARVRSLLRTKALQDRLADILGRYCSDAVAERILRDPINAVRLGGDHRRVTTVFADLRGYTALAAEHPPETTLRLLNSYLAVVNDAVLAREGTVADLMGDGIFALFGAPIVHDDDPLRAVEAAVAMQAGVSRHVIPELPDMRLQLGVGITSGDVVAGNVGSERRMHYAVVGDSVNVAARLQASAGPAQILVDETTYLAVHHAVVAQDVGNLRLYGREKWVHAFNIVGMSQGADHPAGNPNRPNVIGRSPAPQGDERSPT